MAASHQNAPRLRKGLVAALLIGGAAGLGAWFVAAPLRATPARAEPEGDMETTASRARLDALIRVARLPDNLRLTAAAAASGASAAGDDGAERARCGFDQAPEYGGQVVDPDGTIREMPHEIKPAGVGYTGAQQRVDAALRSTGDAYDNAVADWLNVGGLRRGSARLDALVQDALASEDVRIYGLAIAACASPFDPQSREQTSAPASCGRLRASEWARRDAGNGLPWLYALKEADDAGDAAAQRDALRHLETSSRFDLHFFSGIAAVARLKMPVEADLAGQSDLVGRAMGMSFSAPFSAITQRCRNNAGDLAVIAQCEAISRLLFDHSDAPLTRAIGGSIHRLATGDASRLDQAHREMHELAERSVAVNDDADTTVCEGARRLFRHFVRADQIGEVPAIKERIAAHAASAASR